MPADTRTLAPDERAARVKALARAAGFDLAGIASAEPPGCLSHFGDWIAAGYAGELAYLTEQAERRRDLRLAFPWARSVICVALQYDSSPPYSTAAPLDRGWISRYAWGDDYHEVVGSRLRQLRANLFAELGAHESRAYVDTGPIVERAYAVAAGLGFCGKNGCVIHPEHGSWLFLGEVVTDLDLVADAPLPGRCGRCTACLDACPTQALVAPYVLDARRCISYLTIEQRGAIPGQFCRALGRHVFGCDVCQDVCPWNRRRRHRGLSAFEPQPGLFAPALGELAALDERAFRERFRRSAVARTRRRGLLRNAAVALGNVSAAGDTVSLDRLASDSELLIAQHARDALQRISEGT
jgi:epoxyqueuosine reductase